jgi:hypothetical protein
MHHVLQNIIPTRYRPTAPSYSWKVVQIGKDGRTCQALAAGFWKTCAYYDSPKLKLPLLIAAKLKYNSKVESLRWRRNKVEALRSVDDALKITDRGLVNG